MDLPEKFRYNSPEKADSDQGSGSSSDENFEDEKDKDYKESKDSDQESIKDDKHISIDLMLNRRRTYEDLPIRNSLSLLHDSNENSDDRLRFPINSIEHPLHQSETNSQDPNQQNQTYGNYKPDLNEFYDDIKPGRRFRRRYNQIVRHYSCSYPGCSKSYGSLNHLNTHIVTKKHGQRKSKSDFQSEDNHEYNSGNYWHGFASNNSNRYPYYMMVRNQPMGHPHPPPPPPPPPHHHQFQQGMTPPVFMQQPLPMPNQPIIMGQPHPHAPPPPGAIPITPSIPNQIPTQMPTQIPMGNQIPMQLQNQPAIYQVPSMQIPSIQQPGIPAAGLPPTMSIHAPIQGSQQSPGIPNQPSPIQTSQLAYPLPNQDYTVKREEPENRLNNFSLPNIRQINPDVHSNTTSAQSSLHTSPQNVTITLPPIKSDKAL